MQEKLQSLQTTFRQETAAYKDAQQGQGHPLARVLDRATRVRLLTLAVV